MSQVYIGPGKKEKPIGRGFSSKISSPYLIQQRIKSEVPKGEQAEREGSENQAPKEGPNRHRTAIYTAQASVIARGWPLVNPQQGSPKCAHWLLPPCLLTSSEEQAWYSYFVQTQAQPRH